MVRRALAPYADHFRGLTTCGYPAPQKDEVVAFLVEEEGPAFRVRFSGIQTCGSPWACPVCSSRLARDRGEALARAAARLVGLGYRAVCSSRVGLWRRGREQGVEIPRLAVLHSTTERQVDRWITQGGWELRAMELRYQVLSAAKRALGNSRYERLRRAALAVRGRL